MKYIYYIDSGELLTETKEFDTDEQALAYGQHLYNHCNSPYITLEDEQGRVIKEFEV